MLNIDTTNSISSTAKLNTSSTLNTLNNFINPANNIVGGDDVWDLSSTNDIYVNPKLTYDEKTDTMYELSIDEYKNKSNKSNFDLKPEIKQTLPKIKQKIKQEIKQKVVIKVKQYDNYENDNYENDNYDDTYDKLYDKYN
jgi:hypothetical protein